MIAELLCEARLLASELNKDGDPLAIVSDPLRPTQTAERRLQAGQADGQDIRKQLGTFKPGSLQTRLIGVCGMSCSGKSTVTSTLRACAAEQHSYMPVICVDDAYHEFMNEDCSRHHKTYFSPPQAGGRGWKNWETADCVDWQLFLDRLQAKLEVHKGYTPFILIEGFLLAEDETVAAMCDHILAIETSKEVAWQVQRTPGTDAGD